MANLKSRLTVETILAWAQEHHRRNGAWPSRTAGPVAGAPGEKWANLDDGLRRGYRGLPGGQTLGGLLARRLGAFTRKSLPLTERRILSWARAHYHNTGVWPNVNSGPVTEAPRESWKVIDDALRRGLRGLPGGDTLAGLLGRHRRQGRRKHRGPMDVS